MSSRSSSNNASSSLPMSSAPSRRQDYIVKIRYQNSLPPPPFPPKLLKVPITLDDYTSPSYASTLIHKNQVKLDHDRELHMPLNLTNNLGLFIGEKEEDKDDLLENEIDQRLLVIGDSQDGSVNHVSFLRRTEYISSETAIRSSTLFSPNSQLGSNPLVMSQSSSRNSYKAEEQRGKSLHTAELQADEIESFFEKNSQIKLETLEHPRRRNVRAVKMYDLLPETNCIVPQSFILRFNNMPSEASLENTYIVPECLEGEEEQLRLFTSDDDHKKSSDGTLYLKQKRLLEGKVQYGDVKIMERIAVTLDENAKAAWYTQIKGSATMKPKRLSHQMLRKRITHKAVLRKRAKNDRDLRAIKRAGHLIDPEMFDVVEDSDADNEEEDKEIEMEDTESSGQVPISKTSINGKPSNAMNVDS